MCQHVAISMSTLPIPEPMAAEIMACGRLIPSHFSLYLCLGPKKTTPEVHRSAVGIQHIRHSELFEVSDVLCILKAEFLYIHQG